MLNFTDEQEKLQASSSWIWAMPFCPACRTELQDRKEGSMGWFFSLSSYLDCRKQEKTNRSTKEKKNVSVMMLGDCLSDCTKQKVTPMPSSLQKRRTFLIQAFCWCCEGRDRTKECSQWGQSVVFLQPLVGTQVSGQERTVAKPHFRNPAFFFFFFLN